MFEQAATKIILSFTVHKQELAYTSKNSNKAWKLQTYSDKSFYQSEKQRCLKTFICIEYIGLSAFNGWVLSKFSTQSTHFILYPDNLQLKNSVQWPSIMSFTKFANLKAMWQKWRHNYSIIEYYLYLTPKNYVFEQIFKYSLNFEPLLHLISGLNYKLDYALLCVLNWSLVSQNFVLKSYLYQKLSRKILWGVGLTPL